MSNQFLNHIEKPGPNARFADRKHFKWTKEMVEVYERTGRARVCGKVWQKHGICNRCGACCKSDKKFFIEDWVKSYKEDEEKLARGEKLSADFLENLQEDSMYWCNALKKKNDGKYKCAIWRNYGCKSKKMPIICRVEPCDPRGVQWKKNYPKCSLWFEDVTDKYTSGDRR